MIELYKGAKMNWHKYTIDEWLEQFGAWCDTCLDKMPDDLSVNQIYWLIRSVNPDLKRGILVLEISDKEAEQVHNLLRRAIKNEQMAGAVRLLIKHKVEGQSLRALSNKTKLKKDNIAMQVKNAKCFLLGLEQGLTV